MIELRKKVRWALLLSVSFFFYSCGEDEALSSDFFIKSISLNAEGAAESLDFDIASRAYSFSISHTENLTALELNYEIDPLATGIPASGSTLDFNAPVEITITAQDGSSTVYTVNVERVFPEFEILNEFPGPGPGRIAQINAGQEVAILFSDASTIEDDYTVSLYKSNEGLLEEFLTLENYKINVPESSISLNIPEDIPSEVYAIKVSILNASDFSSPFQLLRDLPTISSTSRTSIFSDGDVFKVNVKFFEFESISLENYQFFLENDTDLIPLTRQRSAGLSTESTTLFLNTDLINTSGYKLIIALDGKRSTSDFTIDILETPDLILDPVEVASWHVGEKVTLTGTNFYLPSYRDFQYDANGDFKATVIVIRGSSINVIEAEFVNEEGTLLEWIVPADLSNEKIDQINVTIDGRSSERQSVSIDILE